MRFDSLCAINYQIFKNTAIADDPRLKNLHTFPPETAIEVLSTETLGTRSISLGCVVLLDNNCPDKRLGRKPNCKGCHIAQEDHKLMASVMLDHGFRYNPTGVSIQLTTSHPKTKDPVTRGWDLNRIEVKLSHVKEGTRVEMSITASLSNGPRRR